ncbi:hypothetical protein EDB84DRAFT_1442721 [Lactarius hengduanensis]|nr:hypothetical protein EDB84DRAFT_1442721 [Lactarius hengduanensis]
MDETINSTAYNPVILSKETKRTVLFETQKRIIQARHNVSSDVRSADALRGRATQYEDVMTTSELTASAAMRDVLSAVSEQLSVGSGEMKVALHLKLVEEQVRGGGQAARATRLCRARTRRHSLKGLRLTAPLIPFPPVPRTNLSFDTAPVMSFAFSRYQSLARHGAPLLGIVGLPNVSKAA